MTRLLLAALLALAPGRIAAAPVPADSADSAVTLIPGAVPAVLPRPPVPVYHSDGTLLGTAAAALKNALLVGQKYYASPSGAGTTCSLASPCDLTYAVGSSSALAAGDTLFLRAGTYVETPAVLNVVKSGTAGNQVVIRNYPNETPIVDPGMAKLGVDSTTTNPKVKDCSVNNGSVDLNMAIKISTRDRVTLKGLTIVGGVYAGGQMTLPGDQKWWLTNPPFPGRGATRDSVAAIGVWANLQTRFGGTWNPADSIILDSLTITKKGINMLAVQYSTVTNNNIGTIDCGIGPGINVSTASQFNRIANNYIHDTSTPDLGDAHWLVEGIRTVLSSGYNRVTNNYLLRIGLPSGLTASGNCVTFDAGSYWNVASYNTCQTTGKINFHYQKHTRGIELHHNLSRSSGLVGYQLTSTTQVSIDSADYTKLTAIIPQYAKMHCNMALSSGTFDVSLNNSYQGQFFDNYFRTVNVYSVLENGWHTKQNKWEGSATRPPPHLTNAPAGLQNDTLDFKRDCGAVGSTLTVAGGQENTSTEPPPPPPGGPGRADLWLPFTTRDATNLTHPDLSKNGYTMSEPGGDVLLTTSVFDDSTSDPTAGAFSGAGGNDYLYLAISSAPAIKAYHDSMTVMARVWMDSASLAASAVIARTGTSKPWQMLADSSTSRVRLVYADSLTGTNRSCGGGTNTIGTLIKETWHFTAARYRTWSTGSTRDSATVDIYYGRPGQTVTTLQEHCVVAGDMHLSTGAVDNIGVGRSPNVTTQAWTGRIDEVYLSGRHLTKAAIDSAFLHGVASIEPAGAALDAPPATPSVTSFAMVAGTKTDVNVAASTYADPDGDAHESSTWSITNTKLAAEVHSETDAAAPLTSQRINDRVEEGGNYTARVQYRAVNGGLSAQSAASASLHVPVAVPDSLNIIQLTGTSARVVIYPGTLRTDATQAVQKATTSTGPWTLLSDNATLTRDATGLTGNVWHYFRVKSKTPSVSYADADSSAASAVDSIFLTTNAPTDSLALAALIERSTALASDSSGFDRHGTATGVTAAPGAYAGMRGAKSGEFKPASSSRLLFADQTALQVANKVSATVLMKRKSGVTATQWLIGQKGTWELTLVSGTTPQLTLTPATGSPTIITGTAIACKAGDASCVTGVDTIPRYVEPSYDGANVRIWVCEVGTACVLNKSVAAAIGTLANSTSGVTVGARPTTGSSYDMVFDGKLDEAAFWRNRGIDDTVIQSVATNGLGWLLRGAAAQRAPEVPTGRVTSGITDFGATFTVDTSAYHDPDGDKLTRTCWQVALADAAELSPLYDQCDALNITALQWADGTPGTTYIWDAAFEDSRGNRSSYTAVSTFTTTVTAPVAPTAVFASFEYREARKQFFLDDQPEVTQMQPSESWTVDLDFSEQLADTSRNLVFNPGDIIVTDARGNAVSGFVTSSALNAQRDSYLLRFTPGTFSGLARVEVNARVDDGQVFSMLHHVQVRETLYPERFTKPRKARLRLAVDFSGATSSPLTSLTLTTTNPSGAADAAAVTGGTIVGQRVEFTAEPVATSGTWAVRVRVTAANGDKLEWDGWITQQD